MTLIILSIFVSIGIVGMIAGIIILFSSRKNTELTAEDSSFKASRPKKSRNPKYACEYENRDKTEPVDALPEVYEEMTENATSYTYRIHMNLEGKTPTEMIELFNQHKHRFGKLFGCILMFISFMFLLFSVIAVFLIVFKGL